MVYMYLESYTVAEAAVDTAQKPTSCKTRARRRLHERLISHAIFLERVDSKCPVCVLQR